MLEFTARTYKTQSSDPKLWNRLVNGAFAVTKHKIPFTSIGLDMSLKGQGNNNNNNNSNVFQSKKAWPVGDDSNIV